MKFNLYLTFFIKMYLIEHNLGNTINITFGGQVFNFENGKSLNKDLTQQQVNNIKSILHDHIKFTEVLEDFCLTSEDTVVTTNIETPKKSFVKKVKTFFTFK